jgi:hypothetical protein
MWPPLRRRATPETLPRASQFLNDMRAKCRYNNNDMAANPTPLNQVEGQWEELIRHADQFAGQRVRVTVLSDDRAGTPSMLNEIRRWLAEGDALQVKPPNAAKTSPFGDALIEKFRKQGLVL